MKISSSAGKQNHFINAFAYPGEGLTVPSLHFPGNGVTAVSWGSSTLSLWRGRESLWKQAGKALGKPWQALLFRGEGDLPSGAQEQSECKWQRTAGLFSRAPSKHCPQLALTHQEKHVALLVRICVILANIFMQTKGEAGGESQGSVVVKYGGKNQLTSVVLYCT